MDHIWISRSLGTRALGASGVPLGHVSPPHPGAGQPGALGSPSPEHWHLPGDKAQTRRPGLVRAHRWAQLGWTMPGQAGLWGAGSCPCCSLACAGSDGPRAGVGSWALSQSQEWPKYRFFEWLLIGLTQYLSWIWAGVAQNDWITTGMANGFYLQQSRVWITG